ncbi:unnamed protein product [Toxocara canis]|uniref:ULP_PROTEASE domain-containing protein n=1 Tax=Toxocara canis TaxID=6265 RepID=A0A183UEM3_TOXCA|nr:unnamed protein product [Toxocara canis]
MIMKAIAFLAVITTVWAVRQAGKENESEEQMPDTIWVGSPYGLIPYDIDWAYFNKTKEHVLREADKQRKATKARATQPPTLVANQKGSNEKAEANVTLEDVLLSTSTIEPLTTLQSTACTEEQEETTEITTKVREKEMKASDEEGGTHTSPPHQTALVISHTHREHRPRLPHPPRNTTLRSNKNTTLSVTQRTFPRIPYDIDDLMIVSTTQSASGIHNLNNSSRSTAKNQEKSNATLIDEGNSAGKGYEIASAGRNDRLAAGHKQSRGNSGTKKPIMHKSSEEVRQTNAGLTSAKPGYEASKGVVKTPSRGSKAGGHRNEKQIDATKNEEEASLSDEELTVNITKEARNETRRGHEAIAYQDQRNGNCDTVADILALSNYLQLRIIDSLLSGSVSWPRDERGQFRGMVNHMRRKLQLMSKKSSDKEQFKIIRGHLVQYMRDNKDRRELILRIPIGDWGTVLQLLDCLKKKKL